MLMGFWAKNLRNYLDLTQNELARLASASPKSVDLLEKNEPLPLEEKRRILTELYVRKIGNPG